MQQVYDHSCSFTATKLILTTNVAERKMSFFKCFLHRMGPMPKTVLQISFWLIWSNTLRTRLIKLQLLSQK